MRVGFVSVQGSDINGCHDGVGREKASTKSISVHF